jgi:hypothetical protein
MALNLLRKLTYVVHLLTTRLTVILIAVPVHKQNVYTPLDRSSVAVKQTADTVDIGTFCVQILAMW